MSTPQELSGLLNLALTAGDRLRAQGFAISETTAEAARDLRRTTDPFFVWLEEHVAVAPSGYIPQKELRSRYLEDCRSAKPPRAEPSAKQVTAMLERIHPGVTVNQKTINRADGIWCYCGIAWMANESETAGAPPANGGEGATRNSQGDHDRSLHVGDYVQMDPEKGLCFPTARRIKSFSPDGERTSFEESDDSVLASELIQSAPPVPPSSGAAAEPPPSSPPHQSVLFASFPWSCEGCGSSGEFALPTSDSCEQVVLRAEDEHASISPGCSRPKLYIDEIRHEPRAGEDSHGSRRR
jgi:hypothetical protein